MSKPRCGAGCRFKFSQLCRVKISGLIFASNRGNFSRSFKGSFRSGNFAVRILPPQPTSRVSARCLGARRKRPTFPQVSRISAGLSGAKWLKLRSRHPIPARSLWWAISNLRGGMQRLRFDTDCDRLRVTTRSLWWAISNLRGGMQRLRFDVDSDRGHRQHVLVC